MNVSHDLGIELTGAGDHFLKVVDFEPQQYAVADRLCWVANGTMMMIGMPIVQLQDQPVASPFARVVPWVPQPLIFRTTMPSCTAEQSLVPLARGLNVLAEDERVCTHGPIIVQRPSGFHIRMNADKLSAIAPQFEDWRAANLHAALLVRHGKIVYERYGSSRKAATVENGPYHRGVDGRSRSTAVTESITRAHWSGSNVIEF